MSEVIRCDGCEQDMSVENDPRHTVRGQARNRKAGWDRFDWCNDCAEVAITAIEIAKSRRGSTGQPAPASS